jgi:hypothetical protein
VIRYSLVVKVVLDCLSGRFRKEILLRGLVPAIFVLYFGTLATAAWFAGSAYNWRRKSISWLLYPKNNPEFHLIASFGIALTGLLIIPAVGYIGARLAGAQTLGEAQRSRANECARRAQRASGAAAAALILRLGAILLILAGLIVSHPYSGRAAFPRMHETLARACAVALGLGILMLWLCALKAWLSPIEGAMQVSRNLLAAWSLLVVPAVLMIVLRLLVRARFQWSSPIYRLFAERSFWHLGFWEWIGSAAVFLFLLSSVVLLPDPDI